MSIIPSAVLQNKDTYACTTEYAPGPQTNEVTIHVTYSDARSKLLPFYVYFKDPKSSRGPNVLVKMSHSTLAADLLPHLFEVVMPILVKDYERNDNSLYIIIDGVVLSPEKEPVCPVLIARGYRFQTCNVVKDQSVLAFKKRSKWGFIF